jgi:hypothetical protein
MGRPLARPAPQPFAYARVSMRQQVPSKPRLILTEAPRQGSNDFPPACLGPSTDSFQGNGYNGVIEMHGLSSAP